jgi:hypothetical protein
MSILYIETHLRKSGCQFVYRGSVGAICRTRNNRYSIFSPPGREPAIQKVPKYGMRDLHMFYEISCPYFIKVHVYHVLPVCRNTFISLGQPDCTLVAILQEPLRLSLMSGNPEKICHYYELN